MPTSFDVWNTRTKRKVITITGEWDIVKYKFLNHAAQFTNITWFLTKSGCTRMPYKGYGRAYFPTKSKKRG